MTMISLADKEAPTCTCVILETHSACLSGIFLQDFRGIRFIDSALCFFLLTELTINHLVTFPETPLPTSCHLFLNWILRLLKTWPPCEWHSLLEWHYWYLNC